MDNHLSGNIPQQLDFLPELIVSGFNNLTGTIPNSLGNIFSLDQLDLGNNQFREISFLALNVNHLTGQNPSSSNCTVLEVLDINDNNITGEITASSLVREQINLKHSYCSCKLFSSGSYTIIRCNSLQLQSLEQLDIASNTLEGTIPSEKGKFKTLGALGPGENKLYGSIPDSLAHLQQIRRVS
ncbi:hypothetical protein SUGI_0290350 [Cryptomeria japonica]|nr:hypothetical protein SUGI_0290350 [Cryptomeria japonica]